MSKSNKGKLSVVALSLMIFTSVYGFGNIPVAFYQMGYGAIPWYIIGALLFFIPFAFMATEMGSAFKEARGGIYSWMEEAVNPTFAFVGTFMWYASYVIWMVSVSSKILLPIVNLIFGSSDKMPNIFWISVVAVVWMALITFAVSRGVDTIKKFTSVAGTAVLALNAILIIGAVIVLIANGHPATPISLHSFVTSAAPSSVFHGGAVSYISFLVFAIFAYGGVEAVGGLVDQTDKPEKNFPRGLIISAIIIAIGYSVAILCVGFFVSYNKDWLPQITDGTMNLGTVPYQLIQILGERVSEALGIHGSAANFIGGIFARYIGLSMLLAYMGAFFTLTYSPLKQIITGTPKKLWPGKIGHLSADGLPKFAMWIQFAIVTAIIVLKYITSTGGASKFYEILTYMANVSMTLPYIFMVIGYWYFKRNKKIEKPVVYFKSHIVVTFLTIMVLIVVLGANIMTIIQPLVDYFALPAVAQKAALSDTLISFFSMVGGPVLFAIIGYFMMYSYKKKNPEEYEALEVFRHQDGK
ncbi:glutamate/gamma-aminobutyrate family transporter YjeM [Lactovum miscens]|uniref:Amino acid transporter n=1 Tax=Lactovum miscens TaxID=190387 RepID=A0A841CA58_9LACT|nr:glutamate/gamma-aminobutyrate family transporter YjeM [Lactovum miscens]MBB5888279.1 amino acid transporter [Lactovum miscens]